MSGVKDNAVAGEALKEALKDPAVGPRPITLEEYRARVSRKAVIAVPPSEVPRPPKYRTGVEARLRREIGEVRRRLLLVIGKEERRSLNKELQTLQAERRKHRRERRVKKRQSAEKECEIVISFSRFI